VTYTPAAGWAGADSFTYTTSDGTATATATVSVTVTDNAAPTVAVTSPAAGSSLAGQVTVRASASDNVGVTRVELYRDGGVLLATVSAAPFEAPWNTAGVTPGAHTLYAKAFDAAGNSATSSTIAVTVRDQVSPTVAVTAPASGSSVSGTVAINASASDDVAVLRVELYRDGGVLLGTDPTSPYSLSWDSTTVTPGAHTLYAKAYDQDNVTTSATVSVTVLDATPPTVAITSPTNGSTVNKNANVTIAASAGDNVGVARVEIYVGTTLICSDTSSPYSCVWRTPNKAGVVSSLQAKAYDARGNVGSSAVVQVTTR